MDRLSSSLSFRSTGSVKNPATPLIYPVLDVGPSQFVLVIHDRLTGDCHAGFMIRYEGCVGWPTFLAQRAVGDGDEVRETWVKRVNGS
jgi:hypothetical protein